jgi:hypothetical protein
MESSENERMEELRKTIEEHPLTAQIRADQAAETLKKRQAAAAEIEILEKDTGTLEKLQAEIDRLAARLPDLEREKNEVQKAINSKKWEFSQTKFDREREISRLKEVLYSCYDPAIDQTIDFFRERFEALRRKKISSQTIREGTDIFTLTKKLKSFSNYAAVNGALTYLRVAIEILEKMKLEPAFAPAKIEILKKEIPDTETLQELEVEKPLPKTPDPLHSLPSDSCLDYTIEKLNEKFKKIMGRSAAR